MSNPTENKFYTVLKNAMHDAGIDYVSVATLQTIVGAIKNEDWFLHQGEFIESIEVEYDASYVDSPKYNVWVEPEDYDEDFEDEEDDE